MRNLNISKTYVDKNDPWTGILAAVAFAILSTTNGLKGYSKVQLVFGQYMIIPIKHKVDWELIRQRKQVKINKDNIFQNNHRVDYDYKVQDNVILTKHTAFKYEIPYKGTFVITHCFTNVTVNLKNSVTQLTYNTRRIKPYTLDTKVEYYSSKNMSDDVRI